jgi:hypothetical protein
MAKNKQENLVSNEPQTGLATVDEVQATIAQLFSDGFQEEKTISLGDPESGKVGIYFGELLAEGEPVTVDRIGGKADPQTGVVPVDYLRTFVFNPLNPRTLEPIGNIVHTVISSHQVASICARSLKRAQEAGGRAQILLRWNGKVSTRKGNQMNDFSSIVRIVVDGVAGKMENDTHK